MSDTIIGYSLLVNRLDVSRQKPTYLPLGGMDWRKRMLKVVEERDLDLNKISREAGLNDAFAHQTLKGRKDRKTGRIHYPEPGITSFLKLLQVLQLSFDELMSEAVPLGKTLLAPVIGEAAAGVWLEPDSWDEAKYPPVPYVPSRYSDMEQRAYRVVGPSMNLVNIHDGNFVITVAYWEVRQEPQDGDIVVVERRRDGGLVERTIKEVVIRPDRIELTPRSSDERFQDPIVIPRKNDISDPLEVEIIALVIGSYSPIGR